MNFLTIECPFLCKFCAVVNEVAVCDLGACPATFVQNTESSIRECHG